MSKSHTLCGDAARIIATFAEENKDIGCFAISSKHLKGLFQNTLQDRAALKLIELINNAAWGELRLLLPKMNPTTVFHTVIFKIATTTRKMSPMAWAIHQLDEYNLQVFCKHILEQPGLHASFVKFFQENLKLTVESKLENLCTFDPAPAFAKYDEYKKAWNEWVKDEPIYSQKSLDVLYMDVAVLNEDELKIETQTIYVKKNKDGKLIYICKLSDEKNITGTLVPDETPEHKEVTILRTFRHGTEDSLKKQILDFEQKNHALDNTTLTPSIIDIIKLFAAQRIKEIPQNTLNHQLCQLLGPMLINDLPFHFLKELCHHHARAQLNTSEHKTNAIPPEGDCRVLDYRCSYSQTNNYCQVPTKDEAKTPTSVLLLSLRDTMKKGKVAIVNNQIVLWGTVALGQLPSPGHACINDIDANKAFFQDLYTRRCTGIFELLINTMKLIQQKDLVKDKFSCARKTTGHTS